MFCGYRFRQDSTGESDLAERVDRLLDERGITIGFGGLACGADIVIAEAVLARGGELHVILPFLSDDYVAVSVRPGGEQWVGRYRDCLARAASITQASAMPWVSDDGQYAYGSRLAMGMAKLRANQLATFPIQIAVWDGAPALQGSQAGTALDVAAWRDLGWETAVVPPGTLDRRLGAPSAPAATAAGRQLRAVIFADFAGFSKLAEPQLPAFLSLVFGRIGAILDRYGDRVDCRNSWGDAIFVVADTPELAAEIALAIQCALTPADLTAAGLPPDGGMRISLHYGPVYIDRDPIRRERTFYGTEITLAARIEPRVPVGAIYATQAFAAILMAESHGRATFSHVGFVDLAKDYGRQLIYRLNRLEPRQSSEAGAGTAPSVP